MSEQEQDKFEQWCVVELFGHQRIIGRVSEAQIGGCAFLRVDVPATSEVQAFTKFYGNGAIYGMTVVEETVARAMLERGQAAPISAYDIPQLRQRRLEYDPDDRDSDEDPF